MSSRDQQSQVPSTGRVCPQPRRVEVALEMVDTNQWKAGDIGQSLRHLDPDEKGPDQARTPRDRNAVEIRQLDACDRQRTANDMGDVLQVVARRQLRHHTAIWLMNLDL